MNEWRCGSGPWNGVSRRKEALLCYTVVNYGITYALTIVIDIWDFLHSLTSCVMYTRVSVCQLHVHFAESLPSPSSLSRFLSVFSLSLSLSPSHQCKHSRMKSKQKGGARAEQGTPQGPRRGGGGRGELPPIPGGSLPPIPNQRPPPIPGSHPMRRGPEETYEDPSETFGIPPPLPPPPASSSVHYPGMNHPGMNHPGMDHLGMDDGGFEPDMGIDPGPGIMEDIYGKESTTAVHDILYIINPQIPFS